MMRRKRTMEVFPPNLRNLWNEWKLRPLVLISLTMQILLTLFGNRRKYIPKPWIKVIVWSAYLLADSAATIALSFLLSDLGQIYEEGESVDHKTELKAFWAPFFLLHLGGPDTITAYSLEDNEIYVRHAFQLGVQTAATILILLLGWNGSPYSFLSIPMIFVGVIKYGERTWTLWSACSDRLRDSMLTPPDLGPSYSKLQYRYGLKHAEGFCVDFLELRVDRSQVDLSGIDVSEAITDVSTADALFGKSNLLSDVSIAHALFGTFKRLFVDLVISYEEREQSVPTVKDFSVEKAFNVIAIELGFMYDLLYTKARVIYTLWGLISRAITTTLTSIVLVIFSVMKKQKYSEVDVYITFSLLVVAIILEIYAALLLLFSDQSKQWLIEHKRTTMVEAINRFGTVLVQVPRWSNYMANYSFPFLYLEEKPGYKILSHLHLDEPLEKYRYITYEHVPVELKKFIFEHVLMKCGWSKTTQSGIRSSMLYAHQPMRSAVVIEYKLFDYLEWSNEVEFEECILIWHMATNILLTFDSVNEILRAQTVLYLQKMIEKGARTMVNTVQFLRGSA